MKRRQVITLLAAAGLPNVGRTAEEAADAVRGVAWQRYTLGCLFRVILDDESAEARKAAAEAFTIAERINDACSPLMADAQVQAFCNKPHGEAHEVGPGFFEALEITLRLAELTEGRFDPTIGPLSALWKKARQQKKLPDAEALAKAREAVGWRHVSLDAEKSTAMLGKEGMRLDFGAVARGFAADKMLAKLGELGFARAIIRAGSDFRVGDPPEGAESWNLSAQAADPEGPEDRMVPLAKSAISTAGSLSHVLRIGGAEYIGIIDPATGIGLGQKVSATVIADSATAASALAVAACVAGPEVTRESFAAWGAKAVRMSFEEDGGRKLELMGEFP